MPAPKEHREFFTIDLRPGWEVPLGYPPGIEQKILAGELDETTQTGNRTRLLRFHPGVYTTAPFVHDYGRRVKQVRLQGRTLGAGQALSLKADVASRHGGDGARGPKGGFTRAEYKNQHANQTFFHGEFRSGPDASVRTLLKTPLP